MKTDPHSAGLRFLLEHATKHFDGPTSVQAQHHLDAIEKADPTPVPAPIDHSPTGGMFAPLSKNLPALDRTVNDGSMSVNSPELSSPSALFTTEDVGKTIRVVHAGPNAFTLKTTIVRLASPQTVELAEKASASAAGLSVTIPGK